MDANELAINRILARKLNMPLGVIQNAHPSMRKRMLERQDVQKALQLESVTRRKLAENAEIAGILRGDVDKTLASENAVKRMARGLSGQPSAEEAAWDEVFREDDQTTSLVGGTITGAARGTLRAKAGLLVSWAEQLAEIADAKGKSFSEVYLENVLQKTAAPSRSPYLGYKEKGIQAMSSLITSIPSAIIEKVFAPDTDEEQDVLRTRSSEAFTAAFETMRRAEAIPRSEHSKRFLTKVQALKGSYLSQTAQFVELIVSDPLGFMATSNEVMAEQIPVLGAGALTSRFFGAGAGMAVATGGNYAQERFMLTPDRIKYVKEATGVDMSTKEGLQKYMTDPSVRQAFIDYGVGRGIPIAVAQLASLGLMRQIWKGGLSRTAKFGSSTAANMVLEGAGEAGAMTFSGGDFVFSEVLLEAFAGAHPVMVGAEAYTSIAGDVQDRADAKKAKEWLKGASELRESMSTIEDEKRDAAVEVVSERFLEEGVDEVAIDAEQLLLFDDKADADVLDTLGVDRAEVTEAANEGSSVEVSVDTFVRHIIGQDGFEALWEHTRPLGRPATDVEAVEYEEQGIDQQMRDMEQRALDRIGPNLGPETAAKLSKDIEVIRETVAQQLIALGRSSDEAELDAQLTAKRFATRAIRLTEETGQPVDALALFEADNLRIEGERQAGEVPAGTFFSGTLTPVKAPLEGVNYVRTGPESWVAELDGEQIGRISVIEGAGYVDAVQIFDEKYKRKGIATELYKQVEKDIGRRLFPSPTGIFPDAMGFWKNRLAQMPREEAQALLDESVRVSESKFPKGVPKSIQSNLDELRKTLSFEQEHLEGEPEFIFNQDAPHGDYVNSVSELKNPVNNRKVGPIYRPVAKKDIPKKTRTVYKLMKTFPSRPGVLYPLYAKPQDGVQGYTFGEWYLAESQRPAIGGKDLALRPGIHAVVNPVFDQGKAGAKGPPRVWVEVEVPAISAKTQKESDASPVLANGMRSGITNRLIGPKESYDYKTNPNASTDAGGWPITGSMRAVRVVPNSEIETVLREAGLEHQIENSMSRLSDDEVTALNAQMEKVAAALNPEIREQAEEYAATSFEQAPTFAQDVFDADQLYNEAALSDDGNHTHRISSRLPTTKQAQEDPVATPLTVDLASMKADREKFEYNMQLIAGQLMPDPAYAGFTTNETDPDAIAEAFIEHVVDNLLWLHDQVPAETRERSRQWYVGARAVTTRLAKQYNMPDQAVAAVMAALSPQKDWFQNASLGERVIDIHEKFTRGNRAGERLDKAGIDFLMEKFGNAKNKKTGQYRYRDMIESMAKTPYDKLETTTAKAMWLRAWDETHNPRGYRVLTPEGDWIGKAEGKAGWGSLVEIGKAIEALEDASFENLTKTMGSKNKVRNFYNNILSPHNEYGDVTIDTHAVAAALLRPLAGGSTEVHHNFGSSPEKKKQPEGWVAAKNNNNTGAHGTYGIYAEAYRRAAEARGVEAREMQSITWEAVRGLFTAKFKAQDNNVADIDAIWVLYDNGELTLNEARQQVLERANGIEEPAWVHARDRGDEESQVASYDGELSGIRVPRRSTRGGGAGVGFPQGDQGQARGGFTPSDLITDQDGNPVNLIQIFQKADVSTFLHESGHFWLEQLKADAAAVGGQFQRDFDIVKKWWGSRSLEIKEEAIRRAKKKKDSASVAALQKMTDAQVKTYIRQGDLRGEGATRWLSIAMHEQFARGVEDYFYKGEAPSLDLASLFTAFKVWMQALFIRIRSMDRVSLSPEVSAVMNRMLASDEEIAMMEGQYEMTSLFDNAAEGGFTAAQFTANNKSLDRAKRESKARQLAKHLREENRINRKWWQDELERVKEEVSLEVARSRPYRLIYGLTQQGLIDGSTLEDVEKVDRIDKKMLAAILEREGYALSDLPKGASNKNIYMEGGAEPGVVAAAYGYNDVFEMILELVETAPYDTEVEVRSDNKMNDLHGSLETEGLPEAIASIHGDHVARHMAAELEALRTTEPAFKPAFIRMYAKRRIQEVTLSNAKPHKFLAEERRHAKAAKRAVKAGDRVAAYQHQFQRLVNHRLAEEAIRAQKVITRESAYLRELKRKGRKFRSVEAAYVDKIMALVDVVDFSAPLTDRSRLHAELLAINKFISERAENDGAILEMPAWVTDKDKLENVNNMTYAEFLELSRTVRSFEKQGKLAKSLIVGKENRDRAATKAKMIAALDSRDKSKVSDILRKNAGTHPPMSDVLEGSLDPIRSQGGAVLAQLDAQMLKIEFLLEALDGEPLGVWHQALFQPFQDAENAKNTLMKEVLDVVSEQISSLPRRGLSKGMGQQIDVGQNEGGLGFPGLKLRRGQLIMLALNSGNASNLDKLIRGMGGDKEAGIEGQGWNINEELIDDALQQLTKEEWDLVKAVWEQAEKLWPMVERVYRNENGMAPDRVEPRTIDTPFGPVTGGYFPMIYNHQAPSDMPTDKIAEMSALEMMQEQIGKVSVNSSMTKARTGFAAAVDLNLENLTRGLDASIHYITHYEAVRNAAKILGDGQIKGALDDKVGVAYTRILKQWLSAVSANNGDRPPMGMMDHIIGRIASNTTATMLGFSYTTLFAQTLGLTSSIDRFAADTTYGPISLLEIKKDLVHAIGLTMIGAHREIIVGNEANGTPPLSPFMKFRRDSVDRDIQQAQKNLQGSKDPFAITARLGMSAIANAQFWSVDLPVWIAAYNRALRAEPQDTQKAVNYADRVVRLTQSSGAIKDLSAVMRNNKGLWKAVTMFMTWFSALYAMLREVGVEGVKNISSNPGSATMKVASRIFVLLVLQSIGMGLIRGELPDWEPEDEEDDSMLKWLAKDVGKTAVGGIPILRDIVNGLTTDYGYSGSPLAQVATSIIQIGEDGIEMVEGWFDDMDLDLEMEESWEDTMKALRPYILLGGTLTGLPAIQANRTLKGLGALWDDEDDFEWGDLIRGRTKKQLELREDAY
tara:strand:+ start:270 stop:9086 length:8817 start_codon:yes stop_codon:yes gene_type:complete